MEKPDEGVSESGHEPKSNRLVLVTEPTHPPSFVITSPQIFEISIFKRPRLAETEMDPHVVV